jgi:energy-coupling factor transporter ATP-binding protein EcfA2
MNIKANGIGVVINGKNIFSNVSLMVDSKEMIAITGPSGCGKTTLLNCLGLIQTIGSGNIIVDGKNATKWNDKEKTKFWHDHATFIYQDYGIIEDETVSYNVTLNKRRSRGNDNEIRQKSQSGGIVTALLCYLLDKNEIDGAIVNRFSKQTKRPEVIFEDSKIGIQESSGSYYSQSSVVSEVLKHQDKKTVAVVLGCQGESIELQPEEPIEPEKEKPAAEEPKNTTESEPIKVELKTPAKSSTQTKPSTSKPAPKPEPTPTPTPTPTPPPPPEPTPSRPTTYTVSNPGIFYEVEGSAVPGNKRYAELSIIMICMNRQTRQYDAELYKKQIQELRATILPVLGESITNQVIKAAESKTHTDVRISERFETATKKVWIASNPGDSLVSFQSWSK